MPVNVTPWMKYFWAKKKMRMTGVIMSSEPAISILVVMPASTLHRLEMCQQSITLSRLEQIMRRLRCTLADIFRDQWAG